MSYILDALRKSDQQRQLAKAPTLLTDHAAPETPKRNRIGLNAGLAALLVAAGMLLGWLRPWQTVAPPTPPVESPVPAAITATKHIDAQTSVIPADAAINMPSTLENPAEQAIESRPKATVAATILNSVDRQAQPPKVENSTPSNPSVIAPPTSPVPSKQERIVLKQSELPAAIRQEIPSILIAFHQYSPVASEQRVMINNIVLRPGEYLAPGLRLEQITAEGVVLSYQNYHFLHGLR